MIQIWQVRSELRPSKSSSPWLNPSKSCFTIILNKYKKRPLNFWTILNGLGGQEYLRFANREGLYLPKENLISFNDLLMNISTEFLRLLNPGPSELMWTGHFGRLFSPIPIRGRGRLCPLHTLTCPHQRFYPTTSFLKAAYL